MKLYTEEQVRHMMENSFQFGDKAIDYAMSRMTPIELPSDEEIESKLSRVNAYMDDLEKVYNEAFLFCAKWMKEQIFKQNQ